MATKGYDRLEDATLRKIFAVELVPSGGVTSNDPPVILLSELAEELRSESSDDASLLVSKNNLDRVLMSRLSSPLPAYPLWPVHYLLGCYCRASDEARSVSYLKSPDDQNQLLEALTLAKQLSVSYCGYLITMSMFPQPPAAEQRGAVQLLDALDAAIAQSTASFSHTGSPIPATVTEATKVVEMPVGFLFDFATRFQDEGLSDVLESIGRVLMRRCSEVSVMGDFACHLNVLERLAECKPIAQALTQLPFWLPAQRDGRSLESQSLLGPAFGISAIPDLAAHPLAPSVRRPDVAEQCFLGMDMSRPSEIQSSFVAVQSALSQVQSQLHRLIMLFVRNGPTREATMDWIAAAFSSNVERTKMRPNVKASATDGFMLNLAAVCLRMCEPFLELSSGKAWGKLDARYPSDPGARGHCFPDDTRINASSSEVTAWIEEHKLKEGEKYHFICECFFMTASALRLGMKKGVDNIQATSRTAQHYEEEAQTLEQGGPNHPQARLMRQASERFKAVAMCFEATLQSEGLLGDALSYYRLSAAYLLRLVSEMAKIGGSPELPLPTPPPMEFSSLPEYYIEDLCECMLWAGRVRPDLLTSGGRMEEYMTFFTVFLGSPGHVHNPYLRGRMVEALHSNMPPDEMEGRRGFRRRNARGSAEVATLFEVHPLVVHNMVHSLITLYVDIEQTDRHNAFYEKFNTRYQIGEVLQYLWRLPQHREAWRRVAATYEHIYVRFINMMINDSQHLLQEALEALPQVQEIERLQADDVAWRGLSSQERKDKEEALASHRRHLQSDFALATIYLGTMQYTSSDKEVAHRFFDVQVRDREARILNFFLRYLTLPDERRRLKLKDPEKYGFKPKELIASLAAIHINLYRANKEGWAAAVAADTDYYGVAPQILSELIGVLRKMGQATAADIADLEALAAAAAAMQQGAAEEEEAFDDAPEEFEDPVSCRVMKDPVKLPSGNIMDRGTILQHLLTDQRDPFTRAKMTEEDLEPLPELKARIVAWLEEQRAKRAENAMQE